MVDKIKALLGSIRFWIVTLTAVVAILEGYVDAGAFVFVDALEIFKVWLATVAGLGTLDSVATKFGTAVGKKK